MPEKEEQDQNIKDYIISRSITVKLEAKEKIVDKIDRGKEAQ